MKALHACVGVLALGLVVGCGASSPSGGSTAIVQGSVPPSARTLDDARAVAIGADGRVFWAYLDARGAFTLQLPIGQSYRVIVANALAGGGQRTIGHLVIHPSTGATRWMGIHQSGTIALGALNVPGAIAASTAGTLTTKDDSPSAEGSSSDGSSGQDDVETHEDDGETEALCSSQGSGEEDDQELDAQDDPGDRCSDDDQTEHEQESDAEDGAPCPPADAGGASGSGSGSGSSSGGASGGTSFGGACTVNADCASGLSCIASTCQAAIR